MKSKYKQIGLIAGGIAILLIGLIRNLIPNTSKDEIIVTPSTDLPVVTLDSFEFNKKLDTITYYEGDNFDVAPKNIGSMIPTFIAKYSNGRRKNLSYGDEGLTFSGFDSSKLGEQQIKVSYGSKELSYNVNVISKNDIIIDEQPKIIETKAPNGLTLSVKVRDESKVKSYQWQILNSYDIDLTPIYLDIDGASAKKKDFIIHSTMSSPRDSYFRCEITSINDEVFYSEDGGYVIINPDEEIVGAYLADYPILPGRTLDLSTTPFGTGTISLSSDWSTYTFNNVEFHNETYDTGVFLTHVAFEICNWKNSVQDIYLNFEGFNVFENSYWEYTTGQGGFTFTFNFLGSDTIRPTLHFGGTGMLNSIGGTGMIYANTAVEIDGLYIEISTPEPQRFDKGIICRNLVIKNAACIYAYVGNEIIFIERANDQFDHFLEIQEGCYIQGNINAGAVIGGWTNLHGFYAADGMYIEGSTIMINIRVEAEFFEESMQGLDIQCLGVKQGNLSIDTSSVMLSVVTYPTESEFIPADGVFGISGQNVLINGSDVDIYIQSRNFMEVYGIYSQQLNAVGFDNNSIRVDILCSGAAEGIVGINKILFADIDVDVDVDCAPINNFPYVVSGIRSKKFENIRLYDEQTVDIKVNAGIAIGVPFGSQSTESTTPTNPYVPTGLFNLNGCTVSKPDSYELNQYCYITYYDYDSEIPKTIIKYTPIETIFEAGQNTPALEVLLTSK